MSIADRIKARTSARRTIDVPEWGEDDKPLRVAFGPLTAGELNRLQRKHPMFLTNATFEGMVDLIISKCEDANGEKLFTLEDKPILMREEVNVIAHVAGEIMGGASSVEDHEKN